MQNKIILALDLGTTSVGWCVRHTQQPDNSIVNVSDKILDTGVRIFPEGMDRTRGEKSLNQDRRIARSIRRQGYRRVRRKRNIEITLVELGLLPEEKDLRTLLFNHPDNNPYALRARALDEKLEPYQLGRALYQIGQRRGYLSNRKTGADSDGLVKQSITQIAEQMQQLQARTLGEYLHLNKDNKIRGRYTSRQMYVDEFNLIWQTQSQFHDVLTPQNKALVHDIIFYQRPLKIQKHLIGNCELEPDRKRAYSASYISQQFRLWQSIHNLRVQTQAGELVSLTDAQKLDLFALMSVKKTQKWEPIKKHIGLLEGDAFNIEKHQPGGMSGNQSAAIVIGAIGKKCWEEMNEKQREDLIADLINIEDEQSLLKRLKLYWRLTPEVAQKLCDKSLALPKGTMHLSSKAMRKLLEFMRKGHDFYDAKQAAGYIDIENETPELPCLPLFSESVRNPLVERAMFQVRRVVNSIIKAYGKVDIIRVEFARDLRNNSKQRAKIQKNQRDNELKNNEARRFFEDNPQLGVSNPSRQDLLKHRLWQECNAVCPFTGRAISAEQLFLSSEVQVEHIIPYSRCLNDSYMNKTLCFADENQKKGNLTPYELYDSNKAHYEGVVLQNIKSFPKAKRERFNKDTTKFTDDFVSQQLNETGYISRLAVEYLQQLGCKVETIKGGVTANLRHAWGLNRVLHDSAKKNRNDHRHHALDAIVLAYTDRKAVKKINDCAQRAKDGRYKLANYPEPFVNFRPAVAESLQDIVISHKASHKIKGPLHEDTLYGVAEQDEQGNAISVAIRKPLKSLKPTDLEKIRDEKIREMAKSRLGQQTNLAKAFDDPDKPFGFISKKGDFIPIESVRLKYNLRVRTVSKGARQRNIKTGSNHHVAIYRVIDNKGREKWRCDVVSTLDAKLRNRENQPVVQQQDADGNELVMALHINDIVFMEHKGEENYYRIQKMTHTGEITCRLHTDARTEKGVANGEISKSAESLRKSGVVLVNVNAIGKVRHAQKDH